jgi:hypothetical protein
MLAVESTSGNSGSSQRLIIFPEISESLALPSGLVPPVNDCAPRGREDRDERRLVTLGVLDLALLINEKSIPGFSFLIGTNVYGEH